MAGVRHTGESADLRGLLDVGIVEHGEHVATASSSVAFVSITEAREATAAPAPSEPVRETPWTRSSPSSSDTRSLEMYRLAKVRGEQPTPEREREDVALLRWHLEQLRPRFGLRRRLLSSTKVG